MNNKALYEVSILVVGFDGYTDVWDHFFNLIEKYWPERPKTYLATSELKPTYKNVTALPAGPNTEWSRRAYNALQQIDTSYVILMLEDFFISDYVNNSTLADCIDSIKANGIKYYQIQSPNYKRDRKIGSPFGGNDNIRIIPKDKQYALNLQTVIWDREYLMSVIGTENYNAWLFEMNNIQKEDMNEDQMRYLIDTRNILNITHAIVQSKYLRGAIKHMSKIGYNIDTNVRPSFSILEQFKYDLKNIVSDHAPQCLVRPLKSIGKLMGVDFVTDRIARQQN